MVATVTLSEFGLDELIARFEGGPTVMAVEMNNLLRDIGRDAVPITKEHTPIGATQNLRNFTIFIIQRLGFLQQLIIRQSATSGTGFFYGEAVREGTVPHFPPSSALIPWVMSKLGLAEEAAKSVAFLIARKISKSGTPAQPYQVDAINDINPVIRVHLIAFKQRLAAAMKKRP